MTRPPDQPPPNRDGPGADGVPPGDPPWPGGRVPDGPDPASAFRVPFSAVEGGLLILWTLVAQFLVIIPAVVLGVVDPEGGGATSLLLVVVSQAIGLAGALGWLAVRGHLSWRLLGPRRPQGLHVVTGLGVGVAGFVLVNVIIAALGQLLGPVEPPDQQLLTDVTAGGVATLLAVVAAVVMAPVVEEVVFRGVLFQALKRRIGLWPAAFVSGLVFAAVHVEVQQPIYSAGLLLLGAGFDWSLHRFGSLIVPIVGHATFNGVSVALTLLGSRVVDTA